MGLTIDSANGLPLLNAQEEVVLAQRIERGRMARPPLQRTVNHAAAKA